MNHRKPMRILYTADIHVAPGHLQRTIHAALAHDVDALIVGGDIVPHDLPGPPGADTLAAQARYLKTVLVPALKGLQQSRPMKIFIDLGNDDFAAGRPILEACEPDPFRLLHMQRHALTPQVDLVGYMIVPPTPFRRKDWEKPDSARWPHPAGGAVRLDGYITHGGRKKPINVNIHDHDTIASDMEQLSARIQKPFILVAHSPPYGTPLDLLRDGSHVGSQSIRQFIETWSAGGQLKAALHGHIHESPMISGTNHCHINEALCINPGQGGELQFVLLQLDEMTGRIRLERPAP